MKKGRLKGEAYRQGNKRRQRFRVRMEQILFLASTDEDFRKLLLEDRDEALESRKLGLNDAEREMFSVISSEYFENMIDTLRPDDHGRRKFMKSIAASTALMAVGSASGSCDDGLVDDHGTKGAGPDLDANVDANAGTDADADMDTDTDTDIDADTDMDADAEIDGDIGDDAGGIGPDASTDIDVDADADAEIDGDVPDAVVDGAAPDLDGNV